MVIIIGIYSIKNKFNQKRYIGNSTQIQKRWNDHKLNLKNHKHENYRLQEDYDFYGEDCYVYEVIELCSKEQLLNREIYWISYYDSKNNGYNLTDGGKGLVGAPIEVRDKISKKLSGSQNGMYGVRLIGELNGNYGHHYSELSKKKMSEKGKQRVGIKSNRRRPVQASTGEVFMVMLDAIKWANLKDGSSISKCCNGVAKTAGKHPLTNEPLSWKYRDDLK